MVHPHDNMSVAVDAKSHEIAAFTKKIATPFNEILDSNSDGHTMIVMALREHAIAMEKIARRLESKINPR